MSKRKTNDTPRIRCAIYTRKSRDEGLQREFNPLDAQRDAAEAYSLLRDETVLAIADRSGPVELYDAGPTRDVRVPQNANSPRVRPSSCLHGEISFFQLRSNMQVSAQYHPILFAARSSVATTFHLVSRATSVQTAVSQASTETETVSPHAWVVFQK